MASERVAAEDPHRLVALDQWLVREWLQRTHIDSGIGSVVSKRVSAEDPHRLVALGQWLVREWLQRTHID